MYTLVGSFIHFVFIIAAIVGKPLIHCALLLNNGYILFVCFSVSALSINRSRNYTLLQFALKM